MRFRRSGDRFLADVWGGVTLEAANHSCVSIQGTSETLADLCSGQPHRSAPDPHRAAPDPVRIQSRSHLDPVWIPSRSSLDPIWIQAGSSPDPVWIQSGSRLDPVRIPSGSRMNLILVFLVALRWLYVMIKFMCFLTSEPLHSWSRPLSIFCSWFSLSKSSASRPQVCVTAPGCRPQVRSGRCYRSRLSASGEVRSVLPLPAVCLR